MLHYLAQWFTCKYGQMGNDISVVFGESSVSFHRFEIIKKQCLTNEQAKTQNPAAFSQPVKVSLSSEEHPTGAFGYIPTLIVDI